ncbi:hypothetical protein KAU11_02930 [Candidatus Babeliales bacterium]|nr:hypothetical protein [Candidatus Babeliales bacterium]
MKKSIFLALLFASAALTATQNSVEKKEEAKWETAKVLLEKFKSARIGNSLLKSLRIPPILAALTGSTAWFVTKEKVAATLISAGTFVLTLIICAPLQIVHDSTNRMDAFFKSEELASSPDSIKEIANVCLIQLEANGCKGAGFFFHEMLYNIKTAIERHES